MYSFGLVGKALSYSFSRTYFTEKFKTLNLPYTYSNFEFETLDTVWDLKLHPDLLGFNVTIPYKQSIVFYMDRLEGIAQELNTVNTVVCKDGIWIGHNTDVPAFLKTLEVYRLPLGCKVLILGTGAMAQVLKSCLEQVYQAEVYLVGREQGDFTYTTLQNYYLQVAHLIINTTPLGTYPNIYDAPPIAYSVLQEGQVLYDLVYNPESSLFLQKGLAQNCVTKNGLELLYLQAEASFNIWKEAHPFI